MFTTLDTIAAILHTADDILIAAHANPDGDAIGSVAALGHLCAALGHRYSLYTHGGIPSRFAWLPTPSPFIGSMVECPFTPKLVVTLDCGEAKRLDPEIATLIKHTPTLNIDHHQGNTMFGDVGNWVDPTMAATAQMVAGIATTLSLPFSTEFGSCIYLGLFTDTGSFSFGNTTPSTLRLAADLIESGVDAVNIVNQHENNWSHTRFSLWGHLMCDVRMECNGAIAASLIPSEYLAQHRATDDDLEGWSSKLRKLAGVRVGLLLRTNEKGQVRVSLRSTGSDDIRKVAAMFGGGGHRNAAGITMEMPIEEAYTKLIEALTSSLGLDEKDA